MWLGRLTLLLALFSLSGMDRAFVQGYAWFTMVLDRSTEMGVEAAIQDTLSGEHPCEICEAIAENSYRSPGDSPLRESCENFVKLYSPWLATNKLQATPPNGIGELIPTPVSEKRSMYIELPTPPPRWV
ncbi:hypothetical protein OAE47_01030 [Akkermansiaceae bacterium]|nr:hypothetical protein [Akkermansiaceae bacterium]MDB4623968.1 hypothetical protein [Akkermansiaceae bacterium]MDB4792445.1 hypothetical protein [bacterium]